MPIRGLENFKKQSNQTVYSKVSANILNEGILCIDGYWFLRKYTQLVNVHEIFTCEMKERYLDPVLKLVKMAQDCKFELLWVWDGIAYKKPASAQASIDVDKAISEGYKFYSQGDYVSSNKLWKSLVDPTFMVEDVNNMLKGFNIPVMTAPFSATSQLAYFLNENICSYAFGKTDILIYENVEKIISDICFDKQNGFQVEIINKKSICEKLEIDLCEFKPLAFALGCEFCPTLPEYAKDFILENIVTIIKTEGVDNYLEKSSGIESYTILFYNAYILTEFQPVMKESGKVRPYKENNVPKNIDCFFGKKLPDILYERMFLNLISPEVLNTLAFESFPDTDVDFINLANITYAILKQKIGIEVSFDGGLVLEKIVKLGDTPNKVEFLNIVAPNIQMDANLSVVSQILISKNVKYHMLKHPICSKILSYFDKHTRAKCSGEVQFDEETLRFYLKTIRLRNLLKQCKEAYELVTLTEITISFKERFNLFAPGYFGKKRGDQNDLTIKNCTEFINNVTKFLITNFGSSKSIETITNEINMIK